MQQRLPLLLVAALGACHAHPSEQEPRSSGSSYTAKLPLADLAASTVPTLETLAIEVRAQSVGEKAATFEGVSLNGARVEVEFEAVTPQATHQEVRVTGKAYGSWLAKEISRRISKATAERVSARKK